ncbi:hypothetical protein ACFFU2_05865 [Halomonas alkalicola]|uniref:Uncharacterized protein n=1 Tax=Halomonas alkalicola TaxID=1930622 RepID=A0ABY9H8I3_9GAMM|nr:hypothetical protein [Halomonas alkalicola]WLI74819.1 hypothetical protein B6N23_08095 [Halomonas alkalicola]
MTHDVLKKLGLALLVGMLAAGLVGCQDEPGPAEEAGQELDEAMEDAGESVEEMGESIQDTAEGN